MPRTRPTKRIDIPDGIFSDPDGDEVRIYTASDPTISPPEASNGGDLKWDGNGFVFNRNPDYGGSAKISYFIVDVPPASVGEPIVQPASIVLNVQKAQNTSTGGHRRPVRRHLRFDEFLRPSNPRDRSRPRGWRKPHHQQRSMEWPTVGDYVGDRHEGHLHRRYRCCRSRRIDSRLM